MLLPTLTLSERHHNACWQYKHPRIACHLQVPVLWDKQTQTIVSNESADIIRMMATGFAKFHRPGAPTLYPPQLAPAIDAINDWVYNDINNGAYKAGFASSQVGALLSWNRGLVGRVLYPGWRLGSSIEQWSRFSA